MLHTNGNRIVNSQYFCDMHEEIIAFTYCIGMFPWNMVFQDVFKLGKEVAAFMGTTYCLCL